MSAHQEKGVPYYASIIIAVLLGMMLGGMVALAAIIAIWYV